MGDYVLIGILSGLLSLGIGYSIGTNEILYKDHVQAKAGIFIDVYHAYPVNAHKR